MAKAKLTPEILAERQRCAALVADMMSYLAHTRQSASDEDKHGLSRAYVMLSGLEGSILTGTDKCR